MDLVAKHGYSTVLKAINKHLPQAEMGHKRLF